MTVNTLNFSTTCVYLIISMVSMARYNLHLGRVYLYVQYVSFHIIWLSVHSSINGIVGTWMFLNVLECFWIKKRNLLNIKDNEKANDIPTYVEILSLILSITFCSIFSSNWSLITLKNESPVLEIPFLSNLVKMGHFSLF